MVQVMNKSVSDQERKRCNLQQVVVVVLASVARDMFPDFGLIHPLYTVCLTWISIYHYVIAHEQDSQVFQISCDEKRRIGNGVWPNSNLPLLNVGDGLPYRLTHLEPHHDDAQPAPGKRTDVDFLQDVAHLCTRIDEPNVVAL